MVDGVLDGISRLPAEHPFRLQLREWCSVISQTLERAEEADDTDQLDSIRGVADEMTTLAFAGTDIGRKAGL